jgi:hypothetical protein
MKKINLTKTTIIFLIILGITLLTGCDGTKTTSLGEYKTGTQGLELQFTQNAPPSTMYAEDGSFPIIIEIKNKGVYPGQGDGELNADLYYIGFDNQIISLVDEKIVFKEEEAKTRYNPEGGIFIVNSKAEISQDLFKQARIDTYNANIAAMLCYPYKTYASVDVCLDPNPNRASQSNTCRPGNVNTESQGAPIAVSNVESIAQKGKARFIITINNVGGGEVIRKSEINRCNDIELNRVDFDKVTISNAILSNGMPLDCTPSGDISLINGKANIVCVADGLDESIPAFNSILQLELEYGYRKTIRKTILIQGE